ncbi:MAG: hypothetical protein WD904_10635 [Dehalococcoidia bacterium]
MAITLRRQLNDDEKRRVLDIHGRVCFATGHKIAEGDSLQFDHIHAYAVEPHTEIDNIAPMCEVHNKAKGTLPLEDFRVKLRLEKFFDRGDSQTLGDLLRFLRDEGDIPRFGEKVTVSEDSGLVRLESGTQSSNQTSYRCPTTGWEYFYATLDVEILDSDDDDDDRMGLQPRYLIYDKVFAMYRHFQTHPVLQPSIGRLHQHRILLFDGQHKVAALLWNGRRQFECKVYLNPDLKLLNETNISAHDKFSQTRFFSSVMVIKLGAEFGADFESYKFAEDGAAKSEAGFMKFFERGSGQAMTKAERNRRFRSYLYNSILQNPDCQVTRFVSNGNRSTDEKPLTIDMLSKSIFSCLLFPEPVEDNMETDEYKREQEIGHVIALLNMLYDLSLSGWNPKAGANDGNQRRLSRLYRSKSIMAWTELLRDAICGKLELVDAEERDWPLYRDLDDDDLQRIRNIVERLVNWNMWSSPADSDIDRVLSDNKSAVKEWFRNHGLTTGYLMGASE